MVKRKSKSWFITGSFLLLIGLFLISYDYLSNKNTDNYEEEKLKDFYQEVIEDNIDHEETTENQKTKSNIKTNYIAVIKIPKINLEKGLYPKGHNLNNVNKNIEILKDSNMPNEDKGNFILAGHSGTARISYFKNMYKLEIGDEVKVYFDQKEYRYKITNVYLIDKTSEAIIKRDTNKTTITLITCKSKSDKQYVFVGELE